MDKGPSSEQPNRGVAVVSSVDRDRRDALGTYKLDIGQMLVDHPNVDILLNEIGILPRNLVVQSLKSSTKTPKQ